ncbi:MAG: 3-deoxy-manno-octulosonate cytidylyltransferase [Ignavibacteriae bacterium]|nr:3-deoxy-manno-octulosonate cytidylyltransferase [Ignavibacteriota bacterium]
MVIGVIPARYKSTRLPGKPLLMISGKPMIQRVYESAVKSIYLSEVIVATDDRRIFNCVMGFGGKAVMTSAKHKSGTDRICEAVNRIKADIVVNIQGDEPFIDYKNIDKAIEPLISNEKINVSTLAIKIKDKKEICDSNKVKVVFDNNNTALYFSRSVLPFNRDGGKTDYYKHIGLYVYRKKYLMKYKNLNQTKLEASEKLEQLRILENGEKIKVVITKTDSFSVDTKEDYSKIKSRKRIA